MILTLGITILLIIPPLKKIFKRNKDITKMVLTDWVNSYEKLDYYQWGIVLKDSLTLIGTISIVNINITFSFIKHICKQ